MDLRYKSPAEQSPYKDRRQHASPGRSRTYNTYGSTAAVSDNSSFQQYPTDRPPLFDAKYTSPTLLPEHHRRSPILPADGVPETNSTAVISALRGLQEKIRKLELERSMAESNLRELATETSQYKNILHRDNLAKEVAQTEISRHNQEIESQLSSAESRCNLLERQLEHMRKMVQNSETERNTAVRRTELLEERMTAVAGAEVQAQVEKLERLEREHAVLSASHSVADQKIRDLEDRVQEERHQRKLVQDQAAELQTVAEANRILLEVEKAAASPPRTKKRSKKRRKATKVYRRAKSPHGHYRPNFGTIPFVAGQSTTPSHSVGANVQNILAMMKTHHPAWCDTGETTCPRRSPRPHRTVSATSSSSSSTDSDLNDLLVDLQDEFGRMSFEHQELVKEIQQSDSPRERRELESELDQLVSRMESKGEQITRLRRHKLLGKGSREEKQQQRSRSCCQKSKPVDRPNEVEVITTIKSKGGDRSRAVTVDPNKRMLNSLKTIRTSLRKKDN